MAISGGYVAAQAAKLTVKSGIVGEELNVKGLQGITLPLGFEQQVQEVTVIGQRIGTKYASGASYSNMDTTYYYAKGDASQLYLNTCARAGTQIQDMWFWIDEEDFCALDLISDPGGYVMVGTMGSPSANKNEMFSASISIIVGGSHIMFDKHIHGTTLSFTAGGVGVSAQVTDSGNGFVTAGFAVGDTVIITNLDGADPLYAKVKTVAAGTMTFEDAVGDEALITTETGLATTYIHGGVPIEVSSTF